MSETQSILDHVSNSSTDSSRGAVGQGLYSLADLRAYVGLKGGREDAGHVAYWISTTLNPVDRRPGTPDHSFSDLVSLFVVRELRRLGVSPATIREGERYLRTRWNTDRPFARQGIQTDGRDLFIDGDRVTGQLEKATAGGGQQVMHEVIRAFLQDVRYLDGEADQWSPAPGVTLKPGVRFGEPVIEGTRVPTSSIVDVVHARGVAEAADRFRVSVAQVGDALAFERRLAAARN